MIQDTIEGLKKYEIWANFAWIDIVQRYKRSVIGPFWLTLSNGIITASLCLIWSVIFKLQLKEYVPYFALSNVIWIYISSTINESTAAIINSEGLLKQIKLPLSVLVLRLVWRNLIVLLHISPIAIVALGLYSDAIYFNFKIFSQTIFSLFIVTLFVYILGTLLAILCTRFRDMIQVVYSFTTLLFMATPILWKAESFGSRAFLYELNPFYHLIEIVRRPILHGEYPLNSLYIVLITAVVVGLCLVIAEKYSKNKLVYWI